SDVPHECDLYIGNRGHRVIGLVPRAERRLFWLHNPAGYLKKPRFLCRLAWYQPTLVTTGRYHAATVPRSLVLNELVIIPCGSVVERVVDGVTGHIAGDDDSFAGAAIALLSDDDLWRRYHAEALARQRGQSWDEVAAQFEALI